ncbi:MAG: prepilin-type N-terminal cleavage/methylation domain-containing protein [Candidatus Omnitrophica bacterium]|nr:prepilin-type N-terminal cleavage/methylation domain-containing protein [Candidatus Omnitrophota bacterium]
MSFFKRPENNRHSHNNNRGMTLIELLMAVCIFGLVVLGFGGINSFTYYHVVSSDKLIKLQNAAAYLLEHMAKNIGQAVGDTAISPSPISITTDGSETTITAWIDYNLNGRLDSYPSDRQIAYEYAGAPNYEVRYYYDYIGDANYEVITNRIYSFNCSLTDSYVFTELVACWNPTLACATSSNPALSMKNHIYMPAVTTH